MIFYENIKNIFSFLRKKTIQSNSLFQREMIKNDRFHGFIADTFDTKNK